MTVLFCNLLDKFISLASKMIDIRQNCHHNRMDNNFYYPFY